MTVNRIAAVIPVYNKEPYVARAIGSVLSQTRPVDEIIIVDDASTDGSIERIEAFRDPRIRVLRRTDPRQRGLPATRNLAIRSAASRWIALLDADDSWHKDFIEEIEMLLARASNRTGLLFTGWESIWPGGIVKRDAYSASCDGQRFADLDFDRFVFTWVHLRACPVFPSAVVLRRDISLEAGLFEERCCRGEDKDMWLRMLALSNALSSSRVCSSYYRGIPGQMNDTITTNMRHCLCATLEDMIARSSRRRRRLLKKLFNHEVFEYARAVGLRECVSPDVYRGFFVSLDPQRFLVLLVSSYLPVPIQQLVRRCILWTRRVIGWPRSRAV
jgi:succinoglycan biosynthesis protein ExoO